mmetsp:Transcript_43472/g.81635  ORF Transcript_43472/g.81635 Transcript_43472/m.81635 type:complete len:499 (+) Transcript_43472:63-1559(+)
MSRSGRSRSPRRGGSDENIGVEIEMFIAENNIDETAGTALREQEERVQRLCIDEGAVTGRNTSAILMGRIKRCKVRLEQASITPEDVERFIEENGIDETAAEVLREQAPEVQHAVVEEGKVTGRNASATMMGRIKRAKAPGGAGGKGGDWMSPGKGGYDAGGGWPPMQLGWAPALGPGWDSGPVMVWGGDAWSAGPFKGKGGAKGGAGNGERQWLRAQVQEFCQYNGVDEKAGANLMAQTPPVQQLVLAEGQITGRNPNAVLTSRIKRIMDNGNFREPSPMSRFVSENFLDFNAEQKLREQPRDIQKLVLEEGPLTGRNPSAVLSGRIRRIQEGGGKGGISRREEFEAVDNGEDDALSQFIRENSLDANARQKLHDQTPDVQQLVIEEGPLTGRNPSAVLSGRIRRILEGGGKGGGAHASRPVTNARMWRPAPAQRHDLGEETVDLEQFLEQNSVDAGASDALRQAPPHIQSKVIEEGNLTGRNPSAILLSRIRRAGR